MRLVLPKVMRVPVPTGLCGSPSPPPAGWFTSSLAVAHIRILSIIVFSCQASFRPLPLGLKYSFEQCLPWSHSQGFRSRASTEWTWSWRTSETAGGDKCRYLAVFFATLQGESALFPMPGINGTILRPQILVLSTEFVSSSKGAGFACWPCLDQERQRSAREAEELQTRLSQATAATWQHSLAYLGNLTCEMSTTFVR